MKSIGNRITFQEHSDKTTIVIYPQESNWSKAGIGAWLAMWTVIGITMFWSFSLKLTDQEKIIVVVFLVFWAYYFVKVLSTFAWILWGKEFIKIDKDTLTIKKSIKKYGKAKPYFIENIRQFRTYTPKKKSLQSAWEASPWIKGSDRIEFEHIGSVIKFGKKLEEKDTQLLFKLITSKIDLYIKEKNRQERKKASADPK